MKTTEQRLREIDLDQLDALTIITRAILANAYLSRGLPMPALWLRKAGSGGMV